MGCADAKNDLLVRKDLNSSSLVIPKPDWESYCHKVADMIMSDQTPAKVMEVRGKFYELLSHCIPPTVVLKVRQQILTPEAMGY